MDTPSVAIAKELLALPDDKINILDATLQISKWLWPATDVAAAHDEIERIAARINYWVHEEGDTTDPDKRIRIMNSVIFHEFGYHYDKSDRLAKKLESQVVGAAFATHMGTCNTLPLLYYAVAERMGYPIHAVLAPQHMFLRYDDGSYHSNIEAANGGGEATDQAIAREMEIPPEGLRSGAYMRSLTKRELLAAVVAGMGSTLTVFKRKFDAKLILEKVLTAYPKNAEAHFNLAVLYTEESVAHGYGTPETRKEAWRKAMVHAHRTMDLGTPPILEDKYWDRPTISNPKTFDLIAYLQHWKETVQ